MHLAPAVRVVRVRQVGGQDVELHRKQHQQQGQGHEEETQEARLGEVRVIGEDLHELAAVLVESHND